MTAWARGEKAFGFCDKCGWRYPLVDLKSERVQGTKVNNRICPPCWDGDHPQNFLYRVRTDDREALKDPRPDLAEDESRRLSAFDPVGQHQGTSEVAASVGNVTVTATIWTPLLLFSSGEKGFWYDPSDRSTLYQTETTATSVTGDGDTVGRMEDKSGNGNHATQSHASFRPLYKTIGGSHWLLGDNVNDRLEIGAIGITGSQNRSLFFSGRLENSNEFMINLGDNIENGSRFTIRNSGGKLFMEMQNTGLDSFLSITSDGVYGAVLNGTRYSDITAHANSNSTPLTGNTTVTTNGSENRLFANEVPDDFGAGPLYGMVYINRVLTAQELSFLQTYLSAKAGGAL